MARGLCFSRDAKFILKAHALMFMNTYQEAFLNLRIKAKLNFKIIKDHGKETLC